MKRVWNFFSSITLTITLAVLICMDAVWGSILSMRNPEFFRVFDQEILVPLLASAGFKYLHLTAWIYALIVLTALFAVNTAVCTVDKVYSIIRSRLSWKAFFPHIVHIGFLIALLGHLVGSIWGFRSYGTVVFKGSSVPVPNVSGLYVRLNGMDMKVSETGELESLKSNVTLLKEDGTEAVTKDIEMNGPLIYKGIAFYHFDQGQSPSGIIFDMGGEKVPVEFESPFTSPDGAKFRLGDIYPDLGFDDAGKPYNRSSDFVNPYVEIVSEDGSTAFLDISKAGTGTALNNHFFKLHDFIVSPYVILTINKDPGITYIIAGSIVLVAGMVLLLFFRGERAELIRAKKTI